MTMTASSCTVSLRIAAPRTAAVPIGVAIWERLRISSAMRSASGERRAAGVPTRSLLAARLFVVLAIHRRDRMLVGFLLRVEHQQMLIGIELRLQLVARRTPLNLQVLNRALEIRDSRHRLRHQPLGQQLGILDD